MRSEQFLIMVAALFSVVVDAFTTRPAATITTTAVIVSTNHRLSAGSRGITTALYGYVPSGLTKEEWEKLKKKETEQKKNLGRVGPRGFKSRSMQSFQEALERGEAEHLLPVFNAKERVAKGELKVQDIPYMQRGGAWDNSDVKGAQRKKWLQSDKEYSRGGYKREQSVSIFGYGEGLDWTGSRTRSGPESVPGKAIKFPKNYKPPSIKDLQVNSSDDKPKKKFFGLF